MLVVDDDAPLRRAIARELLPRFDPIPAEGLEEAKSVIATTPLRALVSDLDLGRGMEGLEVLRAMRRKHPMAPRLLVSGTASSQLVEQVLSCGLAHRFIAKPWSPGEVRRSLEELMEEGTDGSA